MHARQFNPSHKGARIWRFGVVIVLVLAIVLVPVTRNAARIGLRSVGMVIAKGTHAVGGSINAVITTIRFKSSLEAENTALKNTNIKLAAQASAAESLARENADLKTILGRADHDHFVLASVIEKPPHSLYDTLMIDGGSSAGFVLGQTVYSEGEIPVGTISEVFPASALVTLYSTSGEKTEVRLLPSGIDVTLAGLGGGNFSVDAPHDLPVTPEIVAVTKELTPHVIARYQKTTSDPRDPFQTLLLSSSINMNELNIVEVKK